MAGQSESTGTAASTSTLEPTLERTSEDSPVATTAPRWVDAAVRDSVHLLSWRGGVCVVGPLVLGVFPYALRSVGDGNDPETAPTGTDED